MLDEELAGWSHSDNCGQWLNIQVETDDEWHSLGISAGICARQLGGIARDSAIDRGISTCQNQAFTFWKRMLLAVKERYSFKDDLMPEKRKQTDMVKRHPLFERTCCGGSLT